MIFDGCAGAAQHNCSRFDWVVRAKTCLVCVVTPVGALPLARDGSRAVGGSSTVATASGNY
jgi:hypothetical protein